MSMDEQRKESKTKQLDLSNLADGARKEMEPIERLGASSSKEDRLESLQQYEERFGRLPYGRARDFLLKMIDDCEPEVSSKAKEVHMRLVRPLEINEMKSTFRMAENIAPLIERMKAESAIFTLSKNLAVSSAVIESVQVNNKLFKQLIDATHILSIPALPSIEVPRLFPVDSAVLSTARMISEMEEAGISGAKGIHKKAVRRELMKFANAEGDPLFNHEGYILLLTMESKIRRIIRDFILDPNEGSLDNVVNPQIRKKCEKLMEEEKEGGKVKSSDIWIDYADFACLADILDKRNAIKHFQGALSDGEFKGMIVKIRELNPIRNKIAHSRILTKEEFDRLTMYSSDIDCTFRKCIGSD